MTPTEDELTRAEELAPRQEAAIVALLTAPTIEEAAMWAGVGKRTLYRWLDIPDFNAAYRKAKRAAFSQALARLQLGAAAAATTILNIMSDESVPTSTRLKAADCVLSHARIGMEIDEIDARLTALEQAGELTAGDCEPV
jgi:hypothetical protein